MVMIYSSETCECLFVDSWKLLNFRRMDNFDSKRRKLSTFNRNGFSKEENGINDFREELLLYCHLIPLCQYYDVELPGKHAFELRADLLSTNFIGEKRSFLNFLFNHSANNSLKNILGFSVSFIKWETLLYLMRYHRDERSIVNDYLGTLFAMSTDSLGKTLGSYLITH